MSESMTLGTTVPAGMTGTVAAALPPLPWWKVPSREWLGFLRKREEQVFLVLTLVIGALVGLTVVAFIWFTEHVALRVYPVGSPGWHRFFAPVIGSLAMGYLLFKYFPDARGSGVPQTKAALYARGGYISLSTVLGKFFCTSATLASGIPLGREGPSVQVGAGLSSLLGRWLGLSPEKVKALIPVGAAAAVAAAFNTPLAAVLFALEEVVGDMHAPVLGSVVLASATSWGMLRLLLGNDPLFKVPNYQLVSPWEFLLYALLGVLGGLMSVAFVKFLTWMRAKFMRLPRKTAWMQPLAGGLVVGTMGWFVPQTLGVGYGYVGSALNGGMALKLMLLLLLLKFFAVTTSYASGNAGGHFWSGAIFGGDAGREFGDDRTWRVADACGDAWGLCAGRHGDGVCGDCAGADDVGGDDIRDDAGLCGDCAADDFESGELFYFGEDAAGADL